ncbi:MAG: hypothetical protein H8E55_64275 [Pelagibacterales bacterium]|nr:hypothetical protein [Pelagibacterales bacterium]
MTDKELKRAKEFLDYFGVKYDGDVIYLTDGGNSVVCNVKTQWQEFLGASINGVAEAVAKKLDKPVKWERY